MSIFEKGMAWTIYEQMETDFIDYLDYVPYTEDHKRVYSPRLIGMLLRISGYIDSVFKAMAEYKAFEKNRYCQEIVQRERDYLKDEELPIPLVIGDLEAPRQESRIAGSAMELYHNAFEKLYQLSSNNRSEIIAKVGWEQPRNKEKMLPFRNFEFPEKKKLKPDWWQDYNAVKHTWHLSIKKANMGSVLDALSGAFLLNAIHLPSLKLLYDVDRVKDYIEIGAEDLGGLRLHLGPIQPRDFKRESDNAEAQASELKPIHIDLRYWIETPLFIFKHSRKSA